jgi:glycolate oxidase FAD binding subunit
VTVAVERVAPADTEQVSEVVARCDRDGRAVAIAGGETLTGMGFAPERSDCILSTTSLSGVVAYERADLTLAARCGTTLQTLSALLAQAGQFIPFDAPLPARATLGGTLAAGWLGPRRHLYGRPRDYMLGSTIVLADGTIARAGGMVVKNVAGYDMSRLYVGSFGTLGVLTQANLKTLALPGRARLFLVRLPEHTRVRAYAQIASLAIRPAAAFWIEGFHQSIDGEDGPEGRLLILLEGSDVLLDRSTRDLRSALGRAGVPETRILDAGAREAFGRVVDAYVASLGERSITYRIASFADDALQRALALHELTQRFELRRDTIVDLMNGDVVLRVSDLDMHALGTKIENFDDAVHQLEPQATVIAGEHPRRTDLRVWGTPPPSIERMRALKARFDPKRTLNPGRFVGAI